MIIELTKIEQPIGTFYLCALPALVAIKIGEVRVRKFNPLKLASSGGIQRAESGKRINEIAEYCSDPDATFPTPIIIAVDKEASYSFDGRRLDFDENKIIGEIIDGQHRIKGLRLSGYESKFDLPVVFMFDLTEEEKAYVFSTINSTQTKVSKSLIYDLFDLAEERSPQKTCHEIARLLNSDSKSPFYSRLKMLGKKETGSASLSQGTFVNCLLELISKHPAKDAIDIKNKIKLEDNPDLPLRVYFINNKDEVIYKIMFNLFNGVKKVFKQEWCDYDRYILSKTTGYGAILRAFKHLYVIGKAENDLSEQYFENQFSKFKNSLIQDRKELTSRFFASSAAEIQELGNLIIKATQ